MECRWNRLNEPVFVAASLFRLTELYFEKFYAACYLLPSMKGTPQISIYEVKYLWSDFTVKVPVKANEWVNTKKGVVLKVNGTKSTHQSAITYKTSS